jgi:hypothetical protein
MKGKLNNLQRSMVQWNALHPYNAVHVVQVSRALDPLIVQKVIHGILAARGLSRLSLKAKRGTYQYGGGPSACEIRALAAGQDTAQALATEVRRQVNTPFPIEHETFDPFRFFLVSEPKEFHLGLAYFHPIADAESVGLLIRDIIESCLAGGELRSTSPMEIHPTPRDGPWSEGPFNLASKLFQLPRRMRAMGDSFRTYSRNPQDLTNEFILFNVRPPGLDRLRRAARNLGVTLNDLFLALLLHSVAPLALDREKEARRRKLSVGCIVNLRRELAVESARTFGLFLGSFVVTHEVPRAIPLEDLARQVHAQTQHIKENRQFLGYPFELRLGRLLTSFFSTERRRKLYPKHYPLWGGITNMNLNPIWENRSGLPVTGYFRAVSTGPVTPLVLAATTIGQGLNIGVTYRPAVFTAAEIAGIAESFQNSARRLVGSPGS